MKNSVKLVRPDGSLYNYSPTREPLLPAAAESVRDARRVRGRPCCGGSIPHHRAADASGRSIGMRRWRTANIFGRSASASPKRWIQRSAAWD